MRIIGGTFRGLRLADLGKGDNAAHLRPTSDRIREALFNVLMGGRLGDPIPNSRTLDLFAGTGALGLEALSRGANHVTFIDQGRTAATLIRDNIKRTKQPQNTTYKPLDATQLPPNPNAPYSLIFLDPPYGKDLGQTALNSASTNGWIDEDALIVWEENSPQAPPPGFHLIEHRRYGDTHITFLEPI